MIAGNPRFARIRMSTFPRLSLFSNKDVQYMSPPYNGDRHVYSERKLGPQVRFEHK